MALFLKLEGSKLIHNETVVLGEILADVDGYYKFWPEFRGGYWTEVMLMEIAQLLIRMNEPLDKEIQKFFEDKSDVS